MTEPKIKFQITKDRKNVKDEEEKVKQFLDAKNVKSVVEKKIVEKKEITTDAAASIMKGLEEVKAHQEGEIELKTTSMETPKKKSTSKKKK